MISLPLTRDMVALIDELDFPLVGQHKWRSYKHPKGKVWYAVRTITAPSGYRTNIFLHRAIMQIPGFVDHKDGDGLNNTRQNLRAATPGDNARNIGKPKHGVTSQYKGVSWNAHAGKFQATVRFNSKNIYLGLFVDEREAAYAYDREARSRFSFFARTNFPLPPMVIPQPRLSEVA